MDLLVAVSGARIKCKQTEKPNFESEVNGTTDVEAKGCAHSILTAGDAKVGRGEDDNIRPFDCGCLLRNTIYPYVFLPCQPRLTGAPFGYQSLWGKTSEGVGDSDERILTEESYFICTTGGGNTKVEIANANQSVITVNTLEEFLKNCDEGHMTDDFFNDLLAFLTDQGIIIDQQRFFNDPEYFQFFFTFSQEIGYGQYSSVDPHWPGGASGVTIGPGYDLKHRTQQEVYDDLIAAGVDSVLAEALSKGAGLSGSSAQNFVTNWILGDISRDEETNLFQFIIPDYIDRSRNAIDGKFGQGTWDSLDPVQQAMLFDIEYNGGIHNYPTFTQAVLDENWQVACVEHVRTSGGQPLGKRTQDFEDLFCEHA